MSFDKKWEKEIYQKGRQVNKYPFHNLVSSINRIFREKNIKKSRALDLGCGTGNNLKFLLDYGFKEIIAVDGSKSAITLAKRFVKSKKCRFFCCDLDNFKFAKNEFDLIIDRGALTHNKKNFIKKKLLDFKFNPHDLSLSNKKTCKTLKIKMTNFKKSLNICKKNFNI